MKNRNPIHRSVPNSAGFCNEKKRFKVSSELLRDVEVTLSSNNKHILGAPLIYVTTNHNRIVGCTFLCVNSPTDVWPIERPINPPFTDPLSEGFLIAHLSNRTNNLQFDNYQNLLESDDDPTIKSLLRKVRKIVSAKYAVHLSPDNKFRLSASEFFRALVIAAEEFNEDTNLEPLSIRSKINWLKSEESEIDLHNYYMLHASLISRKQLWWINLFSQEVNAKEFGIFFNGKCYFPIEGRDIQLFRSIVVKEKIGKLTIYPDTYCRDKLFWVFENRFIPLQIRNTEFDFRKRSVAREIITYQD